MSEYTIILFQSGQTFHSIVKDEGDKIGGASSDDWKSALLLGVDAVCRRIEPDGEWRLSLADEV